MFAMLKIYIKKQLIYITAYGTDIIYDIHRYITRETQLPRICTALVYKCPVNLIGYTLRNVSVGQLYLVSSERYAFTASPSLSKRAAFSSMFSQDCWMTRFAAGAGFFSKNSYNNSSSHNTTAAAVITQRQHITMESWRSCLFSIL